MRINSISNSCQFTAYTTTFSRELDKYFETPDKEQGKKIRKLFFDVYKKKHNERYELGEGDNGIVYKIDDKYLFKESKIYREEEGIEYYRYYLAGCIKKNKPPDFNLGYLTVPENKFKALKTYWGHVVAVVDGIAILRNGRINNKAIEAGVPYDHPDWAREEYYLNIHLPMFAKAKQKAYDRIAQDFKTLNTMKEGKETYSFDTYNPNNIILTGKTMRLVDDLPLLQRKNPNNLNEMYVMLLGKYDAKTPLSSMAPIVGESEKHALSIFTKCLLAAERAGLPFVTDNNYIACLNQDISMLDRYAKKAGLSETFEPINDMVISFREKCPNLEKRLKLIEEAIQKMYSVSKIRTAL